MTPNEWVGPDYSAPNIVEQDGVLQITHLPSRMLISKTLLESADERYLKMRTPDTIELSFSNASAKYRIVERWDSVEIYGLEKV